MAFRTVLLTDWCMVLVVLHVEFSHFRENPTVAPRFQLFGKKVRFNSAAVDKKFRRLHILRVAGHIGELHERQLNLRVAGVAGRCV